MTADDTSDNPIAEWLSATASEPGVGTNDEFTVRRLMKQTLNAYQDLLADPERLAAADAEMAAFAVGEKALNNGTGAMRRGALQMAEWQLLVAAGAGFAAPYLAAIYHHQGRTELAQSWDTLAQNEGLPPYELIVSADGTDSGERG